MLPGGFFGFAGMAVSVVGHPYAGFPVACDFFGHRRLVGIFEFSCFLLRKCRRSPGGGCSFRPRLTGSLFFLAFLFLWPFGLSVLFKWLASSTLLYWSHNVCFSESGR